MINATKSISRHLNDVLLELEKLKARVKEQDKRIEFLEDENKRLRALLETNSSNSSKPPSTDGFQKIFNSREKSWKKPGGQKGHKGHFRQLYTEPTEIIEHKQKFCDCGHEILHDGKFSAKQLVDVELKVNVIEHRAFSGKCPFCKKKYETKLPTALVNPVTYGDNLKAMAVLLSAEGCVAVDRLNQFFHEISNGKLNISNGTIINWLKEMAGQTSEEIAKYKKELLESIVDHKDETSIDVGTSLWWFHVLSNSKTTLYHANKKRGHEADAAMGILPLFKNVLVRDHFAALLNLLCEHQECNAHILRYLKAAAELRNRTYAKELITLLVTAHRETLASGKKERLSPERVKYYEKEYDRIIDAGLTECRHHKEDNPLLKRMKKYRAAHLLFLSRTEVPFDNNLAERDLRMIKTKMKVSGCFRSDQGPETFAAIKSVLSTARKRKENLFEKLKTLKSTQILAGV